jgi:ABC-type antimicrobial peptide transport system permease subunit
MRLILTLFAALIGLALGGFVAYLIYALIYPVYASHYPLDESAECSRGNALAYLSILVGALFTGILAPIKVWRHY